jgi:benzoyl-CoA reductase/2-hydroxyglutaryl-CoA dehydratase subunit BcrC/BadD/HgdB
MHWQRGDWSVLDALSPETAMPSSVPLALVGAPLREPDLCLFDEIEAAGGQVVLDATTTGERGLPPPFDQQAMKEHPLDTLLNAYLHIPDAFQRPNTRLYEYLLTAFKARGVRGVVLRHYVWCDTWQIEAARLEEATTLPILHLDVCEEDDSVRQDRRIQAFLEMLS